MKKLFLYLPILFVLCSCGVSDQFVLAPESRLPKGIEVPPGYTRDQLDIEIIRYNLVKFYRRSTISIYGPYPQHKKLLTKIGTYRRHPLDEVTYEKERAKGNLVYFPRYMIFKFDGISEVYEQRGMNNVLYITDDPKYLEGI